MTTEPANLLVLRFSDAGDIPNNPSLPALVVKKAIQAVKPEERARFFEETWPKHGWIPAWRWGVYDFPHYHSTAHEILGVFAGQATLRIGGKTGATLSVEAGDMIILPAGTGHQNLGGSPDFQVVGGYPKNQKADLMKGKSGERPQADQRIAQVPPPIGDPLGGSHGPVCDHWLRPKVV